MLEKSGLTHGSTWHAAGLVGQLRSKRNLTRLMQYSAQLYGRLEAETGQATEWKPVGSLRLASSEERWSELKRMATTARSFDFELHTLSPKEAQEKFPLITPDGIVGAVFVPNDGSVEPSSLTMAYAKGARAGGVRIVENVLVTGFEADGRRITRVLTDQGAVDCEIVVNAAGIWARDVAQHGGRAGAGRRGRAPVPDHREEQRHPAPACRRCAIPTASSISSPSPGRWPSAAGKRARRPSAPTACPSRSAASCCSPTRSGFEQFVLPAAERLPILNELGIRTVINGPIPISPDGEPIMGLAPERDNFYVACGFTSGIAASGGAGKAMAEWIVEGEPGPRPVGLRRAPLRQPSHERQVSRRAQRRQLLALLPDPLSHRGAASRRAAAGARRSIPLLQGARTPCSARASAGSGPTGSRRPAPRRSTSRPSRAGPTGSARSATNAAPRASAPC